MRLRLPVVAAAIALVLALGGGAWLLLRDSSLVAVQRVTVTGARGQDAAQIDMALESAAHRMTTLDVDIGKLRAAVAAFPSVKDVRVSTAFPHGMRIHVIQQQAVAELAAPGARVTVAGDGTVLRDLAASGSLPTVSVATLPAGATVTDPNTLAILAVLGAAPYQLLSHVERALNNPVHGVVVQLRNGPNLYFGAPGLEGAKWAAADDVLADSGSSGASYIDVTDPAPAGCGNTVKLT